MYLMFFFKQKTAYEMRISDWSSDVCSSDLNETIKRGNPDLQPFRAWQAEIGAEWYFASDSLLNVAAFYKKIDSFVTQITTPQTVDEITFQVTVPGNGDGATVKGFEVGYRQSFANWLPAPFDGFGVQTRDRESVVGGKESVSKCRSRWWPIH